MKKNIPFIIVIVSLLFIYFGRNSIGANLDEKLSIVAYPLNCPELYGAIGDGISDDTIAVETALNQGGTCYITKKYLISSMINIKKDVFITGGGIIKASDNFTDECILMMDFDNVESGTHDTVVTKVEAITLDCNQRCGGIAIDNVRKGTFDALKVLHIKTYGIRQNNGYENTFRSVYFTGNIGNNSVGLDIDSDEYVESIFSVNIKNALLIRGGANRINYIHGWLWKDKRDKLYSESDDEFTKRYKEWYKSCGLIRIESGEWFDNFFDFVYCDTYPMVVNYAGYSKVYINELFNYNNPSHVPDGVQSYIINSMASLYNDNIQYTDRITFSKIYGEHFPISPLSDKQY